MIKQRIFIFKDFEENFIFLEGEESHGAGATGSLWLMEISLEVYSTKLFHGEKHNPSMDETSPLKLQTLK